MAERDPWADFEAAPENDPWAGFQEVGRKRSRKGRTSRDQAPAAPAPPTGPGDIVVTGARDGDTVRLSSGNALRLYGVDAPELKQQGWDRQGNPVPIGQQSLGAMNALLQLGPSTIGPQQGMSYGRAVAPLSVDGQDAGFSLTRQGNALAAPTYLQNDPHRQFQYMAAERLARLNGLGVHDTKFQNPADFRHNPLPAPSRETVAQWWDTPTPLAGMRPEDEQAFLGMINDASVPVEKVVEFSKSKGFVVDPADITQARAQIQKTGLAATTGYKDYVHPLTDQGDGATGAFARGIGSGVLASGLDEAGAFVDMIGATSGRENVWNSDRRLADIWANNQQQNSSILGYDDYAHPYATLGGELAGGLLVPFGARAKTVAELGRVGAAYGGATGFLGADGSASERAFGAAVGVPLGALTGVIGGKAIEYGTPIAKRMFGKTVADFAGNGATHNVDDAVQGMQRAADEASDVPPPPPGFQMIQPSTGMAAEPTPSISAEPRRPDYLFADRPQPMGQPLTDGQRQALAANIEPRDVLPVPSNEVGSVEELAARDAGRFAKAKIPDADAELTRQTVRAWNGAEVPKVGPVDLVGFLRLRGGMADQGGELSHMGMNNAARRGMDFVGQEARFGPLVNETGMTLDDAALQAWEAGYFPELTERPTVAQFLDGLRDTYDGNRRRYLPGDLAEVDRYKATLGEREQFQQARFTGDGKVWDDRSVPAGPDQPFAPPQAYEEWPSGGPDFAGNIDLRKLNAPQDIARALATTQREVGFDAATRGRVAHAETERLAAELNMTPDALIARRKGQSFNAEEALAARQILAKSGNELVNAAKKIQALEDPGDELLADFREKWVRHVAIQEQVAGMTAEAGRALQQFRMMADSRAVRGNVLSAMVKGGGGRDGLKGAADILINAVEMEPGKFNALAEKALQPKWQNKLSELYINFLLSFPQTHAVNITSNTLTALAQVPEHVVGGMVGKARQMLPKANRDRITASEIGQRTFGLLQGAKEGARLFTRALRTGEPSDFISKVEGQEYKAISGLKGEVLRTPTRLLTAEDEFFKGIARRMEMNGIAARMAHKEGLRGEAANKRIAELVSNPTDEMLNSAEDYGRYLTFQSPLGTFAQGVSNMSNGNILAKLFLPFVRTPTNLIKFAAERSPAAPLVAEWRKDFAAGGARRDLAIAKMLVGTGFGAVMYEAAQNGVITGGAPSDDKKARLLFADGWKPYSLKVGDTYYSYARMDPFSSTIGVAADLATMPDGMSERQKQDKLTLLVASILGNLANKTWLSGATDVVEALSDPERNADKMLQRLLGSMLVPNVIAGTARTLDPTQREVETASDAIRNRIPGLREELRPRRNIWGESIKSEGGIGPDAISPVAMSTQLNDPVNKALLQLGYAPGYPSKKVGGRELTPEEYDRYVEMAGTGSHAALTDLVTSPEWRAMDDEAKEKAAGDVVKNARKVARAQLFGGAESTTRDTASDAWGDFQEVGKPPKDDPWSSFKMAPQRDVIGTLTRAIPGIDFTSGFRTRDYQADMRRRGYHPADNSGHLEGASLDLVPPPGKSIGWLAREVRKVEPDARLLPEGDHLHATFPDWFGAPAIGGARSAGLVNPMGR